MLNLILWIIVGVSAGSNAKRIIPGEGPGGMFGDIVIGIGGAILGGLIFNSLTKQGNTDMIGSTIFAIASAIIALLVVGITSRRLGLRY